MSLVSFPSWGLSYDDLVIRAGLYYEKFTATPFTGEIDEGRGKGSFQNGKHEGPWEFYHGNGQVSLKGDFKNGERHGLWVDLWSNGDLSIRNNWSNGKMDGLSEGYFENGQLIWRGHFKKDKKDGDWIAYRSDGTVNKKETGKYKNGVKVSD